MRQRTTAAANAAASSTAEQVHTSQRGKEGGLAARTRVAGMLAALDGGARTNFADPSRDHEEQGPPST
jgi:hypothetical protein